jgi:hypothetical protein
MNFDFEPLFSRLFAGLPAESWSSADWLTYELMPLAFSLVFYFTVCDVCVFLPGGAGPLLAGSAFLAEPAAEAFR